VTKSEIIKSIAKEQGLTVIDLDMIPMTIDDIRATNMQEGIVLHDFAARGVSSERDIFKFRDNLLGGAFKGNV